MALMKMFSDPLLNTYRNMLKECEDKNLSGEKIDAMKQVLERMEQIAEASSPMDSMGFTNKLMAEDLFTKFGTYYSEALQGGYTTADGGYDDSALLKQTVDAYRGALQYYGNSPEDRKRRAVVEKVVALGEIPGISYPQFLIKLIENGLEDALQGLGFDRSILENQLRAYEAMPFLPPVLRKSAHRKLEIFDRMASASPVGIPNVHELHWALEAVDYDLEPEKAWQSEVDTRVNDILENLDVWSLAYVPGAEKLMPWRFEAAGSMLKAKMYVERDKAVLPGIIEQQERLLEKYFGLSLNDIFRPDVYEWIYQHSLWAWHPEFLKFLVEQVLPVCIPHQKLPWSLITERENFHKQDREENKEELQRNHAYGVQQYDSIYGDGEFEKKYGHKFKKDYNKRFGKGAYEKLTEKSAIRNLKH